LTILLTDAIIATVSLGEGLANLVGLAIADTFTWFVCASHLEIGATSTSVTAIGGHDGVSGLDLLVVEHAVAWVLRALDVAIGLTDARVTLDVEGLADGEVLPIVGALADEIL
jgi:hypothetical protein